jgi:arylsulfatase A-like enzyme
MTTTMDRRRFIVTVGAGAAALALPRLGWPQAARRPNLVLIFADDLGYADLGCQGCQDIATPHIDAIATSGVRFTDGYVTAPLCSPSRAGLLTGCYQQRFGHEHNPGNSREAGLPLTEHTIADHLRAAGYATGLVGKWHLGMLPEQHPMSRGFDEFFGFLHGAHSYLNSDEERGIRDPILRGHERVQEKDYLTDAFAREACDFINRHAQQPFFLYLSFNAVHAPLEATEAYQARFPHIEDPKRRTFAGMLAAADDAVGDVLETLRAHRLEQDTLVFFISDNGGPTQQTTSRNDPLRGYKAQVYEGGIRIPFLVQWPGHLPAGVTFEQPVSSLDVLPTALAAAGCGPLQGRALEGVDLAPHLTGATTAPPHDSLFWRMGNKRAARRGNLKLVDNGTGSFELYDLAEDIGEQHDLAADRPEVVAELVAAYEAWNAGNIEPLWVRASFGRAQGQTLRQRFDGYDKDGDGRLSRDEAPSPQWFQRADTDGDGFVSFDEARAAVKGR